MQGAIAEAVSQGIDAPSSTRQFEQCIDHLITLSDCENDIGHAAFLRDIMGQWRFLYSFYDDDGDHVCPCGQAHIKNISVIQNLRTNETVVIGSNCITHFYPGHAVFWDISSTLRKGLDVTLDEQCCTHYHFRINDATSPIIVRNNEMLEFVESTPLQRKADGHYQIEVLKSTDVEVNPRFKLGRRYNVIIHARSNGTNLTYVFFSTLKDAQRVRDETAFRVVEEEEEDEYDEEEEEEEDEERIEVEEPENSQEGKESSEEDDDDGDDDNEQSDEEEEEVLPVSRKRGRR